MMLSGCMMMMPVVPSEPAKITEVDPVADKILTMAGNCDGWNATAEDFGGYLEIECPGKFLAENTANNDQKWFLVISHRDSCDALEADPEYNSSTSGWVYATHWLIHSKSSDFSVERFKTELGATEANFYETVCTSGLVPLDLTDPSSDTP